MCSSNSIDSNDRIMDENLSGEFDLTSLRVVVLSQAFICVMILALLLAVFETKVSITNVFDFILHSSIMLPACSIERTLSWLMNKWHAINNILKCYTREQTNVHRCFLLIIKNRI